MSESRDIIAEIRRLLNKPKSVYIVPQMAFLRRLDRFPGSDSYGLFNDFWGVCRVSSGKQVAGSSWDQQEENIKAFCNGLGLNLVGISRIQEDYTTAKIGPKMKAEIGHCAENGYTLIVDDILRFSRLPSLSEIASNLHCDVFLTVAHLGRRALTQQEIFNPATIGNTKSERISRGMQGMKTRKQRSDKLALRLTSWLGD